MMKEIANIIQIKISTGVGVSAGTGGGGAYGAKAEANLIKVEAKGGLGGGNLDAKVESGVKMSGNAGPLNASGKVAFEMSAVNGASGGLSGEAGAGGVGVNVDSEGVHAQIATEQKDEIIGGEIHVGVGIGAGLNVTQAKGLFNNFLQNVGNVAAFAADSLKSVFSGVSGQTQPNIIPSLSPNQ